MEFNQQQLQDMIIARMRQTAQGIAQAPGNGRARQRAGRSIPCPKFSTSNEFEYSSQCLRTS